MFYGYEQPVQLPSMGVFDTSMMQADIAAAREIYNQAKDDYDKYMEKYSDFVSPVYGATEAFDSLTRGRMQNVVNELYSNGQDPLRSSIGRAALLNAIRTTDYGTLNALKQLAKDYEAYQNMRRDMVAKGLTTDAFEEWLLKNTGLDKFTALDENGNVRQWTRLSPEVYKDIDTVSANWFADIPETMWQDGDYDVTGVKMELLQNAADRNLYDYLNTNSGKYDFENFAKSNGVDVDSMSKEEKQALYSDKDVQQLFRNEIINRYDKLVGERKRSLNKEAEMAKEYQYDRALENLKANNEIRVYKATHPNEFDKNRNPKTAGTYQQGQSYVNDVWNSSIGKIFGLDMYTASAVVANGLAGKQIFKKEEQLLDSHRDSKTKQYDTNAIIQSHTVSGLAEANAKLLDVPVGGTIGGKTKGSLNSLLFSTKNTDKKLYTAEEIVKNTAGCRRASDIKEVSKEGTATVFTVTGDVVGHLNKNGQYVTYVKVVSDSGLVRYAKLGVESNRKKGGQSYASTATTKNREQDLGYNAYKIGSIKQRDALATKIYTKAGDETNDGAFASDYE